MTVRDRVGRLIEEKFCRGRKFELADSDSFLENGIIDSLGMIELVNLISSRFHVTVSDDELMPENLDSVEALAGYLSGKGVVD